MGMLEDDVDYGLKLSRLQEENRKITDNILERAMWEVARTQLRFPQPHPSYRNRRMYVKDVCATNR